jgi:hypothetical protein
VSYTAISDWRYGMDRRRPQSSGVPGTLWLLRNAVITRGGDIERAKKFVPLYVLPAGTFGAYSIRRQKYVFGSGAEPAGMPVGVRYQQLAAPGGVAMTAVLDVKNFSGKIYAIAEYADGNIYHFYDGARVAAWDGLADAAADAESVASRLAARIDAETKYSAKAFGAVIEITATEPGTSFTIAASATDMGTASTPTATVAHVQANVAEVTETRSEATVTITGGSASAGVNSVRSIKVDGVELLAGRVDWTDSNASTANAVALAINDNSYTSGHTATAALQVVTIRAAAGTGAAPNGKAVVVTNSGDVTTTNTAMAGGVAAVAAVAQVETVTIGAATFDATDVWTVTLDGVDFRTSGRASATGLFVFVHKKRVWSGTGSVLRACKIADPTNWTDADASAGAILLSIADEVEGADYVVGMAKYEDNVAIFCRDAIVIYNLPADATQISIVQPLDNTGTLAARSIVSYGASDVFYLDATGVRSLRTRDAIQLAYASDVGSAIDPFVQDILKTKGDSVAAQASAAIEAADGRYMLAVGAQILVLSQFPSSKIVAWSYLDFEAPITDLIRVDRTIYLRAGDVIYAYGGADGAQYPAKGEFPVLVETPFISAKDPAAQKQLQGFDMAAVNTWHIKVLLDPNNTERYVDGGYIDGTTYNRDAYKLVGQTSHFALRMTCDAAGFASLSSTAVHHRIGEKQ